MNRSDSHDRDSRSAHSDPEIVRRLAESHHQFLAFLERRLGDRSKAEDILQSAFVRSVERAPVDLNEVSAPRWFFRVLRNAIADHHRSKGVPATSIDDEWLGTLDPRDEAEACRCILRLADTLKPEYNSALRRMDIDGTSMQDFAREAGISAENASVRLFRARRALRERLQAACRTCLAHGCLDCTCNDSDTPREKVGNGV